MQQNRRDFCRTALLGGAGLWVAGAPTLLTTPRVRRRTAAGTLTFQAYPVQSGRGPHLLNWAYATDMKGDAFKSNIAATTEAVTISDTAGEERFGINVRWNVEGFGYIYFTADAEGEGYALPAAGQARTLNLVAELAGSRVARNRRRLRALTAGGWQPGRETRATLDLSEGLWEDAGRAGKDELQRARLAQQALFHAAWGSERMELEHARHAIARAPKRDRFFVGCDARAFYQMDPDVFLERFAAVFNYATITYYTITQTSGTPDFEPQQGAEQFDTRDAVLGRLERLGMTVEGRPIFWPYKTVTPDWLRNMSFDDLRRYVERHTRQVIGHYGDRMYAWEIVNEFHDWANEVQITPDQAVELTRLACDVAKDTAPNVHRLINNCCPFAEYVQLGKWNELDARYPQRTPWEFMRDLNDAGVDYTITGQQLYFPYRDLQDTILLIERYQQFGRPVQLTEVGATSGPSAASVKLDTLGFPEEPYVWHRPWDEELQADWLEGIYTLAYSKPWIEACNWYDFLDGQSFIKNGGLVRNARGETKAAYDRLARLTASWRTPAPTPKP